MEVVDQTEGAVSPVLQEVVFLIQEVQFKYEIFTDVVVKGGFWWFVVCWQIFPSFMEGKGGIRVVVIWSRDECIKAWEKGGPAQWDTTQQVTVTGGVRVVMTCL